MARSQPHLGTLPVPSKEIPWFQFFASTPFDPYRITVSLTSYTASKGEKVRSCFIRDHTLLYVALDGDMSFHSVRHLA